MLDALDIAASTARQAGRYPSSAVVNASPTSGRIAKKRLGIIFSPEGPNESGDQQSDNEMF